MLNVCPALFSASYIQYMQLTTILRYSCHYYPHFHRGKFWSKLPKSTQLVRVRGQDLSSVYVGLEPLFPTMAQYYHLRAFSIHHISNSHILAWRVEGHHSRRQQTKVIISQPFLLKYRTSFVWNKILWNFANLSRPNIKSPLEQWMFGFQPEYVWPCSSTMGHQSYLSLTNILLKHGSVFQRSAEFKDEPTIIIPQHWETHKKDHRLKPSFSTVMWKWH